MPTLWDTSINALQTTATTQRHCVPLWKADCGGYFWRAWNPAALLCGDRGSGCPQTGTAGNITHTSLSSTLSRFILLSIWVLCNLMQTFTWIHFLSNNECTCKHHMNYSQVWHDNENNQLGWFWINHFIGISFIKFTLMAFEQNTKMCV